IPGVEFTSSWGVIPTIPVPSSGGSVGGSGRAVQALASGGEVTGYSPHPRADNIPIWATAEEYMLPVPAVRRIKRELGPGFLEQLRRGNVPGYADGGLIGRPGGSAWDSIKGAASSVWDGAKSVFGKGWDWLQDI